jgi:hypothetical protein
MVWYLVLFADQPRSAKRSWRRVCAPPREKKAPVAPTLPTEKSAAEQAIAEMRAQVEQNSEYVGTNFAIEARSMHLGDAPERAIYGEAKPEEAKSLIEDGIPVTPLPFMPTRKSN